MQKVTRSDSTTLESDLQEEILISVRISEIMVLAVFG